MQPGVVSADFALLEPRKPAAAPSTSDQPATASTVQPMASAQLHIVGSVTDMSANWSAKVAVNAAAQV